METNKKKGILLFIAYLIVIIWILLFKFALSWEDITAQINNQITTINLIPFGESVIVNGKIDFSEIISNIVIFIPFGGLLGIIAKKTSILKKISYMFFFSLGIELFQYVFGLGATDITDVLTNVTGGIIGLLIYKGLLLLFPENKVDSFLVNLGAILLSIAVLAISFLLFIN